jgi:hypothetical protein
MSEKKDVEDCPVDEKLCTARMQTLEAEIKGIKEYIRGVVTSSVAVAGVAVGVVTVAVELWLRFH